MPTKPIDETASITLSCSNQGNVGWMLNPSRETHCSVLFFTLNGEVVAEVVRLRTPSKPTWVGLTMHKRTRSYRNLKRCVQAVEQIFSVALN